MQSALTLAQLRVFLAIAEHGSFSEAALQLDLHQSTVSYTLAEMERILGGSVFRRGRQGALLTPLGERLLPHARAALAAIDAMHQEAALERGSLSGVIRVATLRSAGVHLLPAIIHDLRREAPDLHVRVVHSPSGSLEDPLHAGQADVSLLNLPVATSLLTWPLLRDEYLAVFARGEAPARLGWEDFAARELLRCNEECWRIIRPHLEAHGVHLGAADQVREDAVILSMIGHGLGMSVMPRLSLDPLPAGLELRSLPDPLWRTLAVATLPNRASTPLVKTFVASARRVASRLAGSLPAQEEVGPRG
ncbi:DNA-binding transcriptional LysR family regulator [Deinobacterium chartae]|uniref:DNA-binding transcriptional LysR family regulator n=1 Tax=Deinobacterium chartae TaxID=521158 RepID=A0A841I424_9DEIO|nr:LysR family transcriptional regulator [Deinobacterium chartae]MBB6099059.1 DNA-binding transcriptional LysR family regulator [Deinobacterium chartae]